MFQYRSFTTTPEMSLSPLYPIQCDVCRLAYVARSSTAVAVLPVPVAPNPAEGRAVPWQCSQSCGASSQHSTGPSQWTSPDRASLWLLKTPPGSVHILPEAHVCKQASVAGASAAEPNFESNTKSLKSYLVLGGSSIKCFQVSCVK